MTCHRKIIWIKLMHVWHCNVALRYWTLRFDIVMWLLDIENHNMLKSYINSDCVFVEYWVFRLSCGIGTVENSDFNFWAHLSSPSYICILIKSFSILIQDCNLGQVFSVRGCKDCLQNSCMSTCLCFHINHQFFHIVFSVDVWNCFSVSKPGRLTVCDWKNDSNGWKQVVNA